MNWPRLKWVSCVEAAVSSSGAVSPAARATPSSTPVTIPGSAVGTTMLRITRQRGAPSASADSRNAPGISSSTTSAERITTGSISSESAAGPDDQDEEDEHPEQDRRHAREHVDEEPPGVREPARAPVLDQPYRHPDA